MNSLLSLPQRIDGSRESIGSDTRDIVIIGANGAGKSRFANRLIEDLGEKAFRISALEALYGRRRNITANSVDTLYEQAGMPQNSGDDSSQFERILAMLMHDEMLNLIGYKLAMVAGGKNGAISLRPTRLDSVISLWQEVFPGSRVLIESGKVLFARGLDQSAYSALRLSDGERAVLFYAGAILYAPKGSIIFVDSPEIFLHPSMMQTLWNRLELLRPDCRFAYTTHDLEFTSTRAGAQVIWVRDFDAASQKWDYLLLPPDSPLTDDMYRALIGARKPVMFIEGDGVHSIDSKLYPLIFKEYSVKSLGSCNKVIEATRTFNDLNAMHHNDAVGIVDRDRRDEREVAYLRRKRVMVPDVAEIENILMLEDIVRAVASYCHRNPDKVFGKVRHSIMQQFRTDLHRQALQHTRHRVKQTVEYRIDGRFANIGQLEAHMDALKHEINPRGLYESFCKEFRRYLNDNDYRSVLRVYNQKSMIPGSNVAGLCGLNGKEQYITTILDILRSQSPEAEKIRKAVTECFGL
ncbi:MAG: DUF4435 domain-containing protein [Muribaculaceae bacterium]|nr:DUF4435 domain-containing protein [Muribaculaceae bacterium]